MTDRLNIALIQDDISWQDPSANRDRYDDHFSSIDDCDLVVLPEFFSTGFYTDPTEKYETMKGETVAWMLDCAQKFQAVITGSLVMQLGDDFENRQFVNRMIWAQPDGQLNWYDKRHLFRFGGEHLNYTGGNQRVVFPLNGWWVALFICYDLRFPVWSRNRTDYDLALYVANWPNSRQYAWDTLLRARAIENQVYVIGVNRLGENRNGDRYSGGSAILDFIGKPIRDCGDRLMTATASLSKNALSEYRESFPASMDSDAFEISI